MPPTLPLLKQPRDVLESLVAALDAEFGLERDMPSRVDGSLDPTKLAYKAGQASVAAHVRSILRHRQQEQ